MQNQREQQLEIQVVQQEAELRRLQTELESMRQQQSIHSTSSAPRPSSARTPHAPPPKRYLFQSFLTKKLLPPNNSPQLPPCEGHTAVAYEGRVILFGGTNGATITNEVFSHNIASGRWRRLLSSKPGNAAPPPRYGHTAVLYGGHKMVVYGGFGPGGVVAGTSDTAENRQPNNNAVGLLNSIYQLDLRSGDWECLSPFADAAAPSKDHSAMIFHNKMYIFGGCLLDGRTNAVRCYDLENRVWLPQDVLNRQAIACNVPKHQAESHQNHAALRLSQADIPAPRSAHSATYYRRGGSQGSMVVFGGRLGKHHFCNDTFQFDLHNNQWSRLYSGGDLPAGRCDHTMTSYRDHAIVLGGYSLSEGNVKQYFSDAYTLDLISCTWTRVELTGGPPLPLGVCGHSTVIFETSDRVVCLATYGGWGKAAERTTLTDEDAERTLTQNDGTVSYRTLNDVWLMHVAKAPEPVPPPPIAAPVTRPMSARVASRSPRAQDTMQADGGVSPRSRPSTAGRTGRPAFVTQSSKATTGKLFGDPEIAAATSGNPKNVQRPRDHSTPRLSNERIEAILSRLTVQHVKTHEASLEALRKKHLRESTRHVLSNGEQQDMIDRLFYQQVLLRDEKRRELEAKYIPTRTEDHVPDAEAIQEMVSRLCQSPERPEPETLKPLHTTTKKGEVELLKRLYYEEPERRQNSTKELEKKYLWGVAAPKKKPEDIDKFVRRLAENPAKR